MSRLAADGLLLITAVLWGVTFVAQKDVVGVLTPLAYAASRFAVSAPALAPLALLERRSARRKAAPGAMRLALAIGLTLFLGTSLQQAGLATTSATNGGFLNACYVVLTPFVVWALSGARPRAVVLAASLVSLLGAWLLTAGGWPTAAPTLQHSRILRPKPSAGLAKKREKLEDVG
ncbi:MAG: DMT family transporter [Hyphomicrobiales bacterium]|nr:DMT family transporter [Hyphomicrobiales bacterium]